MQFWQLHEDFIMGILEIGTMFAIGMVGVCAYALINFYNAARYEKMVLKIISGMGDDVKFDWAVCQRYYQSRMSPLEAAIEMKEAAKFIAKSGK